MSEQVYTVSGNQARAAVGITLAEAGLQERAHLQEWVISNPTILGADVKIVTLEMGQWVSGGGAKEFDRLDVLGIEPSGQLVVAELKRGAAPDTVEMQAIKYAAMASRFTVDTLAAQHAKFLTAREDRLVDQDEALGRLVEHAPDLSDDTLRTPRIVLLASDFRPVVSASAVFLREVGLDISLTRFQAYRTPAGEVVVTVSQLLPLPDVEEFTIAPRAIEQRKIVEEKKREARTVTRLVDALALADGTAITFRCPIQTGVNVDALKRWVDEDPIRGRTTWRNHAGKPLIWAVDGNAYSPTGLVARMFEEVVGEQPRGIQGPMWWVDPDGRTLPEVAQALA